MRQNTEPEDKRKHLELIQGVINRLASNSFLFKGWAITILAGIITTSLTIENNALIWLGLIITILFWIIDSYYLMLERAYRQLYSKVAGTDVSLVDFNMSAKPYVNFFAFLSACKRPIILAFYGGMFIAIISIALCDNFYIKLIIETRAK